MQDIDFDEIDRAVSSVTSPRSTPRNAPVRVDTPAISTTPDPVQTPVETVTTPLAPPVARGNSGRFMDVVHPSSDMRPDSSRPQLPVTPVYRNVVVADVVPEAPAPAVETAASTEAFHWPDSIDAQPEAAPEVVEEPTEEPAKEPVAEPEIEAPAEPEEPAGPPESPFLPDAKVEKRPLGAFSDADSDLLTPEDFPSSQAETTEPSPEPTPELEVPQNHEEPAEVPAELNEDVLLLEGHGDGSSEEAHDTPVVTPEEVPVGPTSITQQYKEKPSSASDASGAIFDTEVYNQALVHTPKKSKKGLVVVWIAALVLVGGGIGAAIYFVIRPMLG